MSSTTLQSPVVQGGGALLPIAVCTLTPDVVLDIDLYIQSEQTGLLALYRSRKIPLNQADLDRLSARGVERVYVQWVDRDSYQRHLCKQLVENEQLSPSQRYQLLREATRALFETVMRHGDLDSIVGFTAEFGSQVTKIVCYDDLTLPELLSLVEHDYYTYTHAVNVTTYSVALADRLGICDRDRLPEIATGALLHDIGKRRIDLEVLNKRQPLTSEERTVLRQHPTVGFEDLCYREDLSWGQLMMVYQHHERVGGQGYPVGTTGENIHLWARVCSITDVFHAITSTRPYHASSPWSVALDYLNEQAGEAFDADMVQCWTGMIQ